MTRKKSDKKQQARKQLKQQRRQARLRRREAQHSKSRQAIEILSDDEVIADMLPFLNEASMSPDMNMEDQYLMVLEDSHNLVNEPELADIVIDPRLCVDTFAEIGQEMGIEPEKMANLSDQQRDIQLQILEGCAQQLLTEDVRQDILTGLNALRLRLKKAGQRNEMARVAAVQSFLTEEGGKELWPMLGLVQAIVHKSMMVGFKLVEASMDMLKTETAEKDGISLLDRLAQAKSTRQVETLLNDTPGMMGYMEKQVDQMWSEGMAAIYTGELHLGVFTQDELQQVAELFAEILGYDSETGTRKEVTDKDDTGRTLIARAEAYITELFTPQRLEQLRERLAAIVNEKACEGEWLGFVFMLMEDMKAEDAVESQKGFLMRALFGEMRTLDDVSAESDE